MENKTEITSRADLVRKTSHSLLANVKEEGQLTGSSISLLYESGWSAPHIHYRTIGGEWTTLPGKAFTPIHHDGIPAGTAWTALIPGGGIEFVCNDGVPNGWDKAANNQNYFIHKPGKYKLAAGKIQQMLEPPQPPTLITATDVYSTSITLSWNPPKNGSMDDLSGFCVYRNGQPVHKGNTSLTWTDTGLKGCMDYVYEVSSINVQGAESPKCMGITVTTNTPGKPGPPQWLKVKGYGKDFIELEWNPPQDSGGASVTAYNIYRTVVNNQKTASMECVGTVLCPYSEVATRKSFEWRDVDVTKDETYSYEVSALHIPEETMDRSPSQALLAEEIKKKASESLLAVEDADNEGPRSTPVTGKASPMLKAPRMGDKDPHIMLQAFNWNSCYSKDGWYNVLLSKVSQLRDAGIDMCWLPPPSDCVDDRGYLPREWYKLDSKYGSDAELRALIKALHESGICPIADIVINHRCAQQKDGQGKWTEFKNPDWSRWAICGNDPSGLGQGAQSTGENIEYAPDIDHTNQKIQEDSKAYIRWLMNDVGFRALRLDFVLGYGAWFQEQYVRAAGSPYAVAEYWHGDVNVLKNYVNATKGVSAVYDFPVYYTLKGAIHGNNFECLSRLPGMMGSDPVRCVTFIENHDTSHLEIVGGKFGDNNQVCRAYADILTHCGIPSIFWSDWSDRGQGVTDQLIKLCQTRRSIGVHSTSRVSISVAAWGLYAAYIDGEHGTIAFKMGSNDWCPHGSGWKFQVGGHEYAVWTKGGK
jgi:alpha-amylase